MSGGMLEAMIDFYVGIDGEDKNSTKARAELTALRDVALDAQLALSQIYLLASEFGLDGTEIGVNERFEKIHNISNNAHVNITDVLKKLEG